MNDVLIGLERWLIDFSALATVLLAAVLAIRWIVRSPAERMAVVWAAWPGLAALAMIAALPQWPRLSLTAFGAPRPLLGARSVHEHEPSETPLVSPDDFTLDDAPIADAMDLASSPSDGEVEAPVQFLQGALVHPADPPVHFPVLPEMVSWRRAVLLGWLATVGMAVAWIALGMAQTWWLVQRSVAAPDWMTDELLSIVKDGRTAPLLALSGRITTAAAVGALRPRILLPLAADEKSLAAARHAALAHEWAHIRHGDLWLLAIERMLLPLLAWNPLFWLVRRGARLDQELLADAAAAGEQPVEYAEALLTWAKSAASAPFGLAGLSLWESPHNLSRRVNMLLDPGTSARTPASRAWQFALAAALVAIVGGLSLFTLRPTTAEEPPPIIPTTDAAAPSESNSPLLAPAEPQPHLPAQRVLLHCVLVETDEEGLTASGLDSMPTAGPLSHKPKNDADARLTVLNPLELQAVLKKLEARPGTVVVKRPRAEAANRQEAEIQFGGIGVVQDENSPAADDMGRVAKQEGLLVTLKVTPQHCQIVSETFKEAMTLDVALNQGRLIFRDPSAKPILQSRDWNMSAIVPLGKILVVATRPEEGGWRRLVLAIEPQMPSAVEGLLATSLRALENYLDIVTSTEQEGLNRSEQAKTLAGLQSQLAAIERAAAVEQEQSSEEAAPKDRTQIDRLKAMQKELEKAIEQLGSGQARLDAATRHQLLRLQREIQQLLGASAPPVVPVVPAGPLRATTTAPSAGTILVTPGRSTPLPSRQVPAPPTTAVPLAQRVVPYENLPRLDRPANPARYDQPANPAFLPREKNVAPIPQFALDLVVLEVNTAELLKALPEVVQRPMVNPFLSVVSTEQTDVTAALEKLEAATGTKVVGRPKLVTRNMEEANVELFADLEGDTAEFGSTVSLTIKPSLAFSAQINGPMIAVRIDGKQCANLSARDPFLPSPKTGGPTRSFGTDVTLRRGHRVILADRSLVFPERALVVVMAAKQVEQPVESEPTPPPTTNTAPTPVLANASPPFARIDLAVGNLDPTVVAETIKKRLGDKEILVTVIPIEQPGPPRVIVLCSPKDHETVLQVAARASGTPQAKAELPHAQREKSTTPNVASEEKPTVVASAEQKLQIKLLEIDLRDAELEVQAAQADLSRLKEIRAKEPSAVPHSDLAKAELAVRRAQLRVEKLKTMLDAQRQEASASPSAKPLVPFGT